MNDRLWNDLVNIEAWLSAIGMERYTDAFLENKIDRDVLSSLTVEDLKDLGVAIVGHRRKILDAINKLANEANNVADPQAPSISSSRSAERRHLTVLFSDLVGSTELSRKLDPEDLSGIIHAYQRVCRQSIERWGGHVAKFLGDGVVAYFGYPTAHEDDAERSVRAGLEMAAAVGAIKAGKEMPLASRIGIATGLVMVGELIGEGSSQEEAVVGETPNLAARLEALAEPGTVAIALGTRQLLGDLFDFQALGPQSLKGFGEPIEVFVVTGIRNAVSRFAARSGSNLTPLVGRRREMALLDDLWSEVVNGEGQVVLVAGEAGIGKSRMIETICKRLACQLHNRVLFQCSPFHAHSALHPIVEQLKQAAGFGRDDTAGSKLDKLECFLATASRASSDDHALLAILLSLPIDRYPVLSLSPQRQMERTLEVLIDQLRDLTDQQPTLLVFEDLHWIDPTSLDFLDRMVEQLRELPVLAIFTYRPGFQPRWLGQSNVHALLLNRLAKRQCATMIDEVTKGKNLPDDVKSEIIAKADGVPLFIEELTKTVLESGLLSESDDHFALKVPLPPLAIPSSIQDSLLARLDRLAPAKEVAQTAAAIGRDFSYELLAAVSDLSEDELHAALDRLISSELIFDRGVPPDATYTFKHALVQDAAYQSLLIAKRQQLHSQIAQVLHRRFLRVAESAPELLAYHFTEAGLKDEAIDYWQKAGQKAVSQSASREAVKNFERGIELLSSMSSTVERNRKEIDLHQAVGAVLVTAQGYSSPDTAASFERAYELCRQIDEIDQHLPVMFGRFLHHMPRDLSYANSIAVEFMDLAQLNGSNDALIMGHRVVGTTSLYLGHFEQADRHFQELLGLYNPKHHGHLASLYVFDPKVIALSMLSLVKFVIGFPDEAKMLIDNTIREARQSENLVSIVHALQFSCIVAQVACDTTVVERFSRELVPLCKEHGFPVYEAIGEVMQGWSLAEQGKHESGLHLIDEGITKFEATGTVFFRARWLEIRSQVEMACGQIRSALESIRQAHKCMEASGDRWCEAELYRREGDILHAQGDLEPAKARLRKSITTAELQSAKSFELRARFSLARILIEQGECKAARSVLAPICNWFADDTTTPDVRQAKALLVRLT